MTPLDHIGNGAVMASAIGTEAASVLCAVLPPPDGSIECLKVATDAGRVVLHCRAIGCGVFRWDYTGEIEDDGNET